MIASFDSPHLYSGCLDSPNRRETIIEIILFIIAIRIWMLSTFDVLTHWSDTRRSNALLRLFANDLISIYSFSSHIFFAKIWEFYCIFYVFLFSLSRSNPFGRYGICHWCQYGERCTHIRCCHKIYAAKYCGRANTNRKINDYAAKRDARCGGGR